MKAIREAVRRWRATLSIADDIREYEAALAEVEAVEKAARTLRELRGKGWMTVEEKNEWGAAFRLLDSIAKGDS